MSGFLRLPGMCNFSPSREMYESAASIEAAIAKNFTELAVVGREVRYTNPDPTQKRWHGHVYGQNPEGIILSWEMYLLGPLLGPQKKYEGSQVNNPWDSVRFFANWPGHSFRGNTSSALRALEPLIEGFELTMNGPSIVLARGENVAATGLAALAAVGIPPAVYEKSSLGVAIL